MLSHLLLALAVSAALPAGSAAEPKDKTELQTLYLARGDSLWSFSQKYLRDPSKWKEILRFNTLPSAESTVALPAMYLQVPVFLVREEFQAAHMISRTNSVFYRRKEGGLWVAAADNMEVFRNDTIQTMKDSRATVRFADNDLMQIDAESMAIVMPTAKDYAVDLKRGGVVGSNKKVRLGSATVAPATAGTVFTASVGDDNTTTVQVYKGEAAVEAAGKSVKVGAGKATSIKDGFAPSLPFDIPDMKSLGSLVSGFEARLASIKKSFAKAPAAAAPALPPEAPSVLAPAGSQEASDLMKEAAAIKMLEPVMGYRIECSRTQDFQYLVAQRYFDDETPMRPEDFSIPRDNYWCRMAPVDLLGKTGKFKTPKIITLGGGAP